MQTLRTTPGFRENAGMTERDRLLRTMVIASLALLIVAASFALAQEADGDAAAKSAKKDDGIEKRAKDAEEAIRAEEEQPKGFLGYLEALWDRLYKLGGRVMIFLAAAAIIGLASILERALSLLMAAGSVRGPVKQARTLWAQERFGEIEKLVERKSGITARLIDFIVRHREFHASDVSAGVGDLASRYIKRHVRRNYPLAVVATISPLLGLLGTILGMIEAFEKVELAGSMGDASYLSGAISKALITTAGGLIIAIPALFFYHVNKFLTGVLADTLEGKANEMVTGWLMRKEAGR